MLARTTEEQRVKLAKLMISMNVPKEETLDIMTALGTVTELRIFLDKLSERNFQMTPEEVYQAMLDTIAEAI